MRKPARSFSAILTVFALIAFSLPASARTAQEDDAMEEPSKSKDSVGFYLVDPPLRIIDGLPDKDFGEFVADLTREGGQ